jgi:hypothetical protein
MNPTAQRMTAYASTATGELLALARWWATELKDLATHLGRWITARADRKLVLSINDDICIVRFEDQPAPIAQLPVQELANAGAMVAELPRRASVKLVLPAGEMLICWLRLPAMRGSDLSAAIDLQLERKLPLPRNLVYVDWRVESRARGAPIDVAVAVVRRATVDRVAAPVRSRGWKVSEVEIQGHSGWTLHQNSSAVDLSIHLRDRWLLALMAILAMAYLATVAGHWIYERTSLEGELVLAREQAANIVSQRALLENEGGPILRLRQIMAAPDAEKVLQAVTSATPLDTWAYRTQISAPLQGEGLLEISGYTPTPQVLVGALDQMSRLERVELTAVAAGADTTGKSRVELRARLAQVDGSPEDRGEHR